MLTDTQIRNLKPAEKAKKYADGGGLYLYVAKTGSKLWRMAYRFNDKEKLLSFGEYPIVSLKDARTKRNEAKKLLADGIDPSRHKKEMKNAALLVEANTFEHVVREWHETQTIHNSPKDRKRKLSTFEFHLFSALKRKPISEVTAQDLLLILKPLERKGKELIAHRIIQYCGMVFRYAVATGRVTRNIAADLRGAIRPHQGRHRATIVSAEKIGVLLNRLDNYHGHFQVRCALRLFSPALCPFRRTCPRRMERVQSGNAGMAHTGRTHEDAKAAHRSAVITSRCHSQGASCRHRGWNISFSLKEQCEEAYPLLHALAGVTRYGVRQGGNVHSWLSVYGLNPAQ